MPGTSGINGINESAAALNRCGIKGSRAGIRSDGRETGGREGGRSGLPRVPFFGARNASGAGAQESTGWVTRQAGPRPR
jgi:hypothetical protein